MFTNNTKKYGAMEPDLFEVEREDIMIEDAEVEKNGRLGESTIGTFLREYIEEKEFALSTEPEDRMSGSGITSFLDSLISTSSFFCSDQEVGRVLLTETMHQKVKYGSLTPEMRKKCDEARRVKLAKLMKYDTYDMVRKENVPAGATVLDMLVVDTLKMKAGGEREFKARAVARRDQDLRQSVETTTYSCPPDSVHFVLLAALASPNYRKNSIASVDCQNAYL
uniref:Reverse transcriptase Ty1/copia-type domain-containing protein n=1 Tax=Chromera velia CCMP2878 TaxID=1169474 RepID=A0A0G4HY40_9ALVE|eukprot:Cvel_33382.t1-p1 / transcript=Cvel_33382.t1 / gene=Cvel_33382 / organism=Chromera_velia_CCMP2878 / gene_product=hypothetical protein / transcript_product=hypothetical protein / location=Cvel_scaffold5410:1053-1718(-) / protein_length=222 / sequence_SO=supercontig / SO=protein_coding / is_pseudo=false